jgi:Tol biopolymer transport system component
MNETEFRHRLFDLAEDAPSSSSAPPALLRRARRRVVLTIASSVAIAVLVVGVGIAGVRALQTAPTPADPPTPTPTPESLGSLAYAVDGDIYVADWDGSNAVPIADGRPPSDCHDVGEYSAQGPIWSPDGRYLAYQHMDCNAPAFQTPGSWWDVVISDAEGNVVTSFPSEAWGISWSPDSTRVAVWVNSPPDPPAREGDPSTIGIYGLNGERQTLLTLPDSAAGIRNPVWSPDGRSLLLDKFEIPLDGSTRRPLPWIRGGRGWSLSPDGSRVAYTYGKSLVVAAADGSAVVAPADGSAGIEVLADGASPNLLWSPTGDRIAFTSQGSRELRLVDVATGTVTLPIEPDGSAVLSVIEFSPDGDRILFSRTEEDGTGANSLWSVNADGSHLRRLVTGTDSGDWLSPSQAG